MEATLETARLQLRPMTDKDFDLLFALHNDPEVMRFINGGQPVAAEEVRADMGRRLLTFGYWAAVEKSSCSFIGWFGLKDLAQDPHDTVELGYRLRRAFWGKGYATEGSLALIDKCFTDYQVRQITANTMTVNAASRHVMEKAGLHYVRTFFLDWPEGDIEGSDQGDVEYVLDRADWQARQGA